MSTYLRRSVDCGPRGVQFPGSDQDYRYHNLPALFGESKTRWVRLWAFWRLIQPDPGIAITAANNPGRASWEAFDGQVQLARSQGRNVILTVYEFPGWANGTAHLVPGSADEIAFGRTDRMNKADWDKYVTYGTHPPRKPLSWRRPTDLAPQGPWAQFVRFLCDRYRDSGDRVVAVEIVNEPNGQLWPQRYPSNTSNEWDLGDMQLDCDLATFMQSAQQVSGELGHPCYLMAPATDDGLGPATKFRAADVSTRERTRYDDFTNALLTRLGQINFNAHWKFLWTHHNYRDVEDDVGQFSNNNNGGVVYKNRAADVRSRLVGRWGGWPQGGGPGGDKSQPGLFITEGGARRKKIVNQYGGGSASYDWKLKQKDLVKNNWQRNYQNTGDGAGIHMIANYLMYTDPDSDFDCGLRNPLTIPPPGAPPPPAGQQGETRAAYDYWKTLPDMP